MQAVSTQVPTEEPQPDEDTQLSAGEAGTIGAQFSVRHRVNFGESIKLIGSSEALGGWNIRKAVELQWSHGDTWQRVVPLGEGVHEFKVCSRMADGVVLSHVSCNIVTSPAVARTHGCHQIAKITQRVVPAALSG